MTNETILLAWPRGVVGAGTLEKGISRACWGRTSQSWRRLFLSGRSYCEARAGSHPTKYSCSWQLKHSRSLDRLYPEDLKVLGSLAEGCQWVDNLLFATIGGLIMFPYTKFMNPVKYPKCGDFLDWMDINPSSPTWPPLFWLLHGMEPPPWIHHIPVQWHLFLQDVHIIVRNSGVKLWGVNYWCLLCYQVMSLCKWHNLNKSTVARAIKEALPEKENVTLERPSKLSSLENRRIVSISNLPLERLIMLSKPPISSTLPFPPLSLPKMFAIFSRLHHQRLWCKKRSLFVCHT